MLALNKIFFAFMPTWVRDRPDFTGRYNLVTTLKSSTQSQKIEGMKQ
jgi:hypothetical protein